MATKISNPIKEFYQAMKAAKKVIEITEKDIAAINTRINHAMEESDRVYSKKERESLHEATMIILNA